MGLDLVVEYLSGFTFGLLIFQALFMKDVLGGSQAQAVKRTVLPEWLSMNSAMAGKYLVIVILMSRDPAAMEPTSPRFWGGVSLAALVGAVLSCPVNWWLVKTGLKHGMGTQLVLGQGGVPVTSGQRSSSMAQMGEVPSSEVKRTTPVHAGSQMQGMQSASARVPLQQVLCGDAALPGVARGGHRRGGALW